VLRDAAEEVEVAGQFPDVARVGAQELLLQIVRGLKCAKRQLKKEQSYIMLCGSVHKLLYIFCACAQCRIDTHKSERE
jgi:hypothetical protein